MISLLFPAFNRLEFTRQSWAALMRNTDWNLVSEFHVYDDGSTDGTRQFLADQVTEFQPLASTQIFFHCTEFRSPMGVTLDWIRRSRADMLAKLDNDTIYPPGWLNVAMDVMRRNPNLDCLGLECMRQPVPPPYILPGADAVHTPLTAPESLNVLALSDRVVFHYLPAEYVSGLGLYRRVAFRDKLPEDNGYFGFEEFMTAHCKSGWILPSLPVFLLDRMPTEPWKSLSESYVRQGWQRPWSLDLRYKMHQADMWNWFKAVE